MTERSPQAVEHFADLALSRHVAFAPLAHGVEQFLRLTLIGWFQAFMNLCQRAFDFGIGDAVAGALIIGVLSNGLNLLEVSSYNQQVIKGLVFIFAVLLDYFVKGRWSSRQSATGK